MFTQEAADQLAELGIPRDRVFVIPSGVDASRYLEPSISDRFRVLYVGRIDDQMKGADLLARIALGISQRSEHDIHLTIIGSGPAASRFARFKDDPNVAYRGFVTQDEKVRLLGESDLMISTSYMEPYSLSVMEGLVSGLPVVTTNTSGPRSMILAHPILGKLVARSVDEFLSTIIDYKSSWQSNADDYLTEKRSRRLIAAKLFDQRSMLEGYSGIVNKLNDRVLVRSEE